MITGKYFWLSFNFIILLKTDTASCQALRHFFQINRGHFLEKLFYVSVSDRKQNGKVQKPRDLERFLFTLRKI